MAKSML